MPKTRAKVDAFMSDLHVVIVGPMVVVARKAHGAVALQHRDTAAGFGERDAHGVLHRAPFAREIGDGDAARAALVDAPDAIARLGDREERRRRVHQPPLTESWFFTCDTPLTCRVTSSARFLVSSESTTPLSVTTPLSLSTLIRRSVFRPTLFMSAVCTLVVSAPSRARRVFCWRPSSVAWSLVFSCDSAGAAASRLQRMRMLRVMRASCGFSAAARGRLRVDDRRLLDRRPADLLLEARPLAALVGRELDRRDVFH